MASVYERVRSIVAERLGVDEDKVTRVVRVSITWIDRAEAAKWVNEYVAMANQDIQHRELETTMRRLDFLKNSLVQAESVELRDAISRLMETQLKTEMVVSSKPDYAFRVVDPGLIPDKKDKVIAIAIIDPNAMLLVAGENGIGKRTTFDDYRKQKRGGKGIITMKTGEKTGNVVGALSVTETDELMLITTKGQMVRTRVREIRAVGRNTMGVKLMDLRGAEKLQAIAPVVSQESAEAEAETAPAETT